MDQQGLEAGSYFFLDLYLQWKNAFIMEAETVNVGTEFIIRDTAQEVEEHIEK